MWTRGEGPQEREQLGADPIMPAVFTLPQAGGSTWREVGWGMQSGALPSLWLPSA